MKKDKRTKMQRQARGQRKTMTRKEEKKRRISKIVEQNRLKLLAIKKMLKEHAEHNHEDHNHEEEAKKEEKASPQEEATENK